MLTLSSKPQDLVISRRPYAEYHKNPSENPCSTIIYALLTNDIIVLRRCCCRRRRKIVSSLTFRRRSCWRRRRRRRPCVSSLLKTSNFIRRFLWRRCHASSGSHFVGPWTRKRVRFTVTGKDCCARPREKSCRVHNKANKKD